MPRCKNCKQKFEPTYFNQKICNGEDCKDAHKEYKRTKAAKPNKTGHPINPTIKPIKKISNKQAKINAAYSVIRQQYLKNHPVCEVQTEVCNNTATEIHHKQGRGRHSLDESTFIATCRFCHNYIHFVAPKWARENGFLK